MRKILQAIFVFWGVITIVFTLFIALGNPLQLLMGQTGDKKTLQNIAHELHLDKPKWQQYLYYLNDVSLIGTYSINEIETKQIKGFFVGSEQHQIGIKLPYLGISYQSKKKVTEMLGATLPATVILALAAMLLATVAGINLGVLAAIKKGTWLDLTAIFTSIAGISAPSFFIGIIVAYLFGFILHSITGLDITGSLYEVDALTGKSYIQLKNLILPAFTLGIRPLAIIAQLTRSSMLDVLNKEYIRMARAKGLPNKLIYYRHALPNALNPVITAITGWLAELLAGSFFVEYIFGWNGIGKLTVDALEKLDYPVVMGAILVSAFIFISINIFTDFLHKWLDPRVQ